MSNFEINVKVAKKYLPCDYLVDEQRQTIDLVSTETYLGPHGEPSEREVKYGEFNPCGSWQDAGPIIQANNIAITPVYAMNKQGQYEKTGRWRASAGEFAVYVESERTIPLLAAMEVFLMMEDES